MKYSSYSRMLSRLLLTLLVLLLSVFGIFHSQLLEQRAAAIPEGEYIIQVKDYLNHEQKSLPFLSEEEDDHMRDVRLLFDVFTYIMIGCTFLLLYFRPTARDVKYTSYILGSVLIVGLFFTFIDFSQLWNLFHYVFFPQGNWTFPYNSMLITLFPLKFFQQYVIQVFLMVLGYAVVLFLSSIALTRLSEQR